MMRWGRVFAGDAGEAESGSLQELAEEFADNAFVVDGEDVVLHVGRGASCGWLLGVGQTKCDHASDDFVVVTEREEAE